MIFGKNSFSGFLGKGNLANNLLGAGKTLGKLLDEPIIHAGITAIAPEIGAGIAAAKKFGLLERLKHA